MPSKSTSTSNFKKICLHEPVLLSEYLLIRSYSFLCLDDAVFSRHDTRLQKTWPNFAISEGNRTITLLITQGQHNHFACPLVKIIAIDLRGLIPISGRTHGGLQGQRWAKATHAVALGPAVGGALYHPISAGSQTHRDTRVLKTLFILRSTDYMASYDLKYPDVC